MLIVSFRPKRVVHFSVEHYTAVCVYINRRVGFFYLWVVKRQCWQAEPAAAKYNQWDPIPPTYFQNYRPVAYVSTRNPFSNKITRSGTGKTTDFRCFFFFFHYYLLSIIIFFFSPSHFYRG